MNDHTPEPRPDFEHHVLAQYQRQAFHGKRTKASVRATIRTMLQNDSELFAEIQRRLPKANIRGRWAEDLSPTGSREWDKHSAILLLLDHESEGAHVLKSIRPVALWPALKLVLEEDGILLHGLLRPAPPID